MRTKILEKIVKKWCPAAKSSRTTEEQAENPDGSIRNQEHRLKEAIEWRNRTSSFGELAGVYIDAGISAKNMNRPKLQEMLKDAKLGKINLIMVTELSRLSRNLMDFVSIWDMLKNNKCSFLSLREDFDTTTAVGEMVLFQSMTMAQYERKQVSERVHLNILARASRELHNGGSIPLGYKNIQRIVHHLPSILSMRPLSAYVLKHI